MHGHTNIRFAFLLLPKNAHALSPLISHVYVRVCQRYLSIRSSDYLSVRELCLVIILLLVFSGRYQLYYFKEYCPCVLQYCKHLCKS